MAVADAVILGTHLDGMALVIDVGRTRRGDMQRVAGELQRVQANLLGVVLNRISPGRDGYYNHYYYYQGDNGQGEKSQGWLSWLQRRFQPREELGV